MHPHSPTAMNKFIDFPESYLRMTAYKGREGREEGKGREGMEGRKGGVEGM